MRRAYNGKRLRVDLYVSNGYRLFFISPFLVFYAFLQA